MTINAFTQLATKWEPCLSLMSISQHQRCRSVFWEVMQSQGFVHNPLKGMNNPLDNKFNVVGGCEDVVTNIEQEKKCVLLIVYFDNVWDMSNEEMVDEDDVTGDEEVDGEVLTNVEYSWANERALLIQLIYTNLSLVGILKK